MGELVGLGLRNLAHCPIELNLMPQSALKGKEFGAKKPYLIATMACLVAILFAFGYFNDRIASLKQESLAKLQPELVKLQGIDAQVEAADKRLRVAQGEALQLGSWLEARSYWGTLLNELRNVLMKTEREGKAQFKTDTGIWIERFVPDCAGAGPAFVPAPNEPGPGGRGPGGRGPGGPGGGRGPGGPGGVRGPGGGPAGGPSDLVCSTINIICRGVDLTHVAPNANTTFAFMLDKELKASPMLAATNSGIVGNLSPEGKEFTVQVVVTPKRPLKL
jgi:hypothetical protein